MTTEIKRLDEQLRRTLEGEAWHGPSVLEALDGVSAAQAAAHPIAGGHSIWELVLHIRSDYDLVLRRMEGNTGRLSAFEDWPDCPAITEENWRRALVHHSLSRYPLFLETFCLTCLTHPQFYTDRVCGTRTTTHRGISANTPQPKYSRV